MVSDCFEIVVDCVLGSAVTALELLSGGLRVDGAQIGLGVADAGLWAQV